MRPERSKEFRVGEKCEWNDDLFHAEQHMRRGPQLPTLAVPDAVRRWFQGVRKLLIAFKYKGYQMAASPKVQGLSIPWWKIGLAVVTIFILTKKDIQFSLNMKAPVTAFPVDEREDRREVDALGIAQPVRFGERRTSAVVTDREVQEYIARHSGLALREMREYGIPASIKMAQAILESDAGKSDYALYENNHFGRPLTGGDYSSVGQNWEAHSRYLAEEFPRLFKLGDSYKKWALGLKKMGYSTRRNYDEQLIRIIERYQLYLLDE